MKRSFSGVELMIIVAIVLILASTLRGCFAKQESAVKALETQGYNHVQITDKDIVLVGVRGCSRSDAAKFEATALNPAGKPVEVFVCMGWPFKGATVRSR